MLILDEPTSSLAAHETEKLFQVMQKLKSEGMGIVFITHFLEQVYVISDRITVLRNGRLVGTYDTAALPRYQLVERMIGRELGGIGRHDPVQGSLKPASATEPVLEARDMGRLGVLEPFNLDLYAGEVLGVAGLLGSGRTELANVLFGVDKADSGTLSSVTGEVVKKPSPIHSIRRAMAYCPEDRKADGVVGDLTVRENIILALQSSRGWFKFLSKKKQNEIAEQAIKQLNISTPGPEQLVKNLSGGNQQKVILARWLATHSDILILDEPTRGIDVGTKAEIQKLVLDVGRRREGVHLHLVGAGRSPAHEPTRRDHARSHPGGRAGRQRDHRTGDNGNDRREFIMTATASWWGRLRNSSLFWPLVALALVMLFNVFFTPNFFRLEIKDGHLFGSLIDILNRGGTAHAAGHWHDRGDRHRGRRSVRGRGHRHLGRNRHHADRPGGAGQDTDHLGTARQDVSYTLAGLVIVITLVVGDPLRNLEWAARLQRQHPAHGRHAGVDGGRPRHCPVDHRCGRSSPSTTRPFSSSAPAICSACPFPLFIVAVVFLFAWLVTRRTAIGLFIESVGTNASASYYSGVNEKNIKLIVYVFCSLLRRHRRPHHQLQREERRRQQRGPLRRAGRHPVRGDRWHTHVGWALLALAAWSVRC